MENFFSFKMALVRLLLTTTLFLWFIAFIAVVVVAPFGIVGSVFLVFTPFSFLEGVVFTFLMPATIAVLSLLWQRSIREEAALIRAVGYKRALWSESIHTPAGDVLLPVVIAGVDVVVPHFWRALLQVLPHNVVQSWPSRVDIQDVAAYLWSCLVLGLEWLVVGPNVIGVVSLTYFLGRALIVHKWAVRSIWRATKFAWFLLALIWCADNLTIYTFFVNLVAFIKVLGDGTFILWVRWRLTHLFVCLTVLALDAIAIGRKYTPVALDQLAGMAKGAKYNKPFAAVFRERLMQATIFVSDLALPHYIRGTRPPTKEGLQESLDALRDLGWPVNVELSENIDPVAVTHGFREWVLCGTDWKQGIHNLKMYTDELLDKLRTQAIEFRRTEEYANVHNELEATSRYFKSPRYDYPDLDLDDVWFLVGDIYRHSRLTPFNYIIGAWEKRYGLGAFFRRPGSRGKLSRASFIKSIGGLKPFKQLWRRTFEFATMIVPVSAVSVKGEALPPKKWLNDKVRSIIGSPLVHYIASTIWNYEPNHRFMWTSTPIKVGMPLNGYWLADVYHRHSRCQAHFAGDVSSFDSVISGKVIDTIKAIRKKGYEEHRDHDRICALIDVAYDQLEHQLLNTTSTGNIYRKGTGLTTGHSSTTADNSLALAILYLFAWKELTGLGAREFVHFNELSCYGDDHVLSFLATKPAAWNFKNIQKVMARWGVENRLEASGSLSSIPFLSKFSRKVTFADRALFNQMQIAIPKRVVYHDRERLLGKMVAKIKNPDPRYRAKRLLSYLSLTAHHEDLYLGIKKVLTRSSTMKRALRTMGVQVPTYRKILSDWYNPSAKFRSDTFEDAQDEAEQAGRMFCYGKVGWGDTLLGVLSLVPDIVNPSIFNFGYDRLLQLQARDFLAWPIQMLAIANKVGGSAELRSLVRKSAYSALIVDIHPDPSPQVTNGDFLLRHWLYMAYYMWLRPSQSVGWFASFNSKILQLQFIANAEIGVDYAIFAWRLLDLGVIAALNLVPLSPYARIATLLHFPRIDVLYNAVSGAFMSLFWSNVPANYKEATHLLRRLASLKKGLLIEAPTGTGKSTAFIKHISLAVGQSYSKIVVIQPRSILVKSLVPYVRDSLGVDATGRTTGFDFDRTRHVWYVTAQEALLHSREILAEGNLIFIDEAHISEPAYELVKKVVVETCGGRFIMATATPSEQNIRDCSAHCPLNIASVWTVMDQRMVSHATDVQAYLREYRTFLHDRLAGLPSVSKALVFYPSIEGAKQLADSLPHRCSLLNSSEQDVSGSVIISTNVADAGVTIPNVDIVISPCVDYLPVGIVGQPVLHQLSLPTLLQRRGRTGRTNNGSFFVLAAPNLRVPDATAPSADLRGFAGQVLSQGIPTSLLKEYHQEAYQALIRPAPGVTPTPEDEVQFNRMMSNLEYFLQGRRDAEMASASTSSGQVIFDYTAAGAVADSSLDSVGQVIENVVTAYRFLRSSAQHLTADDELARRAIGALITLPGTKAPYQGFFSAELMQELCPITFDEAEHRMEQQQVMKL